ncbi:hypothetical protein J6590_065952 [Homalodisca vitripennis]|nr:hypothetical protein J6590_065952 [Homalodisca vitripennis]
MLRSRGKESPLTLDLGTNGLNVTSGPPPMAGQTGCLQSLSIHEMFQENITCRLATNVYLQLRRCMSIHGIF